MRLRGGAITSRANHDSIAMPLESKIIFLRNIFEKGLGMVCGE